MVEWVYVFLGILPVLYLYITWNNNYWKKKGILQLDPLPVVGNLLDALLLKKGIKYIHKDIYEKFPGTPVIGFYELTTPVLMVNSPEIIQTVLVKDFSSFHDNYIFTDEKNEPYIYRDAFFSQGQHWKIHRSAIVPVFKITAMKSIFPQMKEIAKQLEDHLDSNLNTDIEAKQLAFLFTTDIVSNCAFGISGNSFSGTEAVFQEMGKLMVTNFQHPYLLTAMLTMPKLTKLFKWKVLPESVGEFLKTVVMQTEEYRKKNNIDRNDFLQYVLNLRGKKISPDSDAEYSMTDVVGYAMTFFLEGFETSAMTASFTLYELACNPDIQENLRAEILSIVTKREDLDFEKLHSITYLDKVVSETLRKYPVVFSMTRMCTHDTILDVEGKSLPVQKGTPIVIPVYSIQNDPKYYPNPEKFDPERFSQENVSARPQYTYLPFGEGARKCLGMRFGLTQVKLFLATILLKYDILQTEKTPRVMRFNKRTLLTTSEESLIIKFVKREA